MTKYIDPIWATVNYPKVKQISNTTVLTQDGFLGSISPKYPAFKLLTNITIPINRILSARILSDFHYDLFVDKNGYMGEYSTDSRYLGSYDSRTGYIPIIGDVIGNVVGGTGRSTTSMSDIKSWQFYPSRCVTYPSPSPSPSPLKK